MTKTNTITVDLDSATGPRVSYPAGTDAEDVEAAVPEGWEVDWATSAADNGLGTCASPLVEVAKPRTDDGGEVLDPAILARQAARRALRSARAGSTGNATVYRCRVTHLDRTGYAVAAPAREPQTVLVNLDGEGDRIDEWAPSQVQQLHRFTWSTDAVTGSLEAVDALEAQTVLVEQGEWPTGEDVEDGAWATLSDADGVEVYSVGDRA